ncbi:MAG: hypothetical protein HC770_08475 [Pseudanabaena sp. CRU_2_10]|nr:hypothetical protein [Pseudanabaena sp. CRU_2_10]
MPTAVLLPMNDMRSPSLDTETISDLSAKLGSGNEATQLQAIATWQTAAIAVWKY